jgi:DNA-binding winged helix-turn-helix (wHTH) protein/tetratricopeptide (TPR) repeat protein
MPSESFIQLGDYQYYPQQQRLFDHDGQELKLRPQSLAVLDLLVNNSGEICTKDKLFQTVWSDVSVPDVSLVQCISDIRRVIGDQTHEILQTVPRRGYKLIPSTEPSPDSQSEELAGTGSLKSWQYFTKQPAFVTLLGIITLALVSFIFWPQPEIETAISTYKHAPATDSGGYASTLFVKSLPDAATEKSKQLAAFQQELQVALGRYGSVLLTDNADAEYQLLLDEHALGKATTQQITLQLKYTQNTSTLFTESYDLADAENAVNKLAIRAAAAIASPGVGAIGRHLLKSSQLKSADELTPAECYAYGYGCTKCSGEEDVVDFKAKACIANLLEKNPNDAKAWALQATLYSHQYLFGTTLKEPERSSLPLRKSLPQKAIDAATKAESLSTGNDSAIYWGLSQAYYTSCQADKMKAAIDRGLEINPDDPNLLAAFGNWLQYSGRWDEGSLLTKRALEIEPDKYKKWWLMGPAKAHFAKEEYEQAYQVFLKSFNARNWLSHLQMAYTLPYLDRVEEAKAAIEALHRLLPGFTIENALEFYRMFCFDDSFLQQIQESLLLAGLPSRGKLSPDLKVIEPVRAKTIKINEISVEYTDVGQGEPVVFVHGSVSDYRTWAHYLLPISENHRYISYSQRYFGSQPWQDEGEKWSADTSPTANRVPAIFLTM